MPVAEGTFITPALRLIRPLGAGGMGQVWIAEHVGLRSRVVVKFIAEKLLADPEAKQRFAREAAAASQVRSPHIVQMIDHGISADGTPYIAMELLEGQDLAARLRLQPIMPPREVALIVTQVAKALSRAHERGIVHRDIKPENIFLADFGGGEAFVKVLDFGVAKAAALDSMRTTVSGLMLGTPLYMSPEQAVGARTLDHRPDLWSLGVVAFEALTGRPPFIGETIGAMAIAICHGPLPVPSQINPGLPKGLDAWFGRACERDVERRFATATELAEELERVVGGSTRVKIVQEEDDLPTRVDLRQPAAAKDDAIAIPKTVARAVGVTTMGSVSSPRARSVRPFVLGLVLAVVTVVGGLSGLTIWWWRSGQGSSAPDRPATSQVSPGASAHVQEIQSIEIGIPEATPASTASAPSSASASVASSVTAASGRRLSVQVRLRSRRRPRRRSTKAALCRIPATALSCTMRV